MKIDREKLHEARTIIKKASIHLDFLESFMLGEQAFPHCKIYQEGNRWFVISQAYNDWRPDGPRISEASTHSPGAALDALIEDSLLEVQHILTHKRKREDKK